MKTLEHLSRSGADWRRRTWAGLWATALATALLACGGGVESGGGSGAPVVGFSQGPITGFGSIVVNGIHYDETAAKVLAEDGSTRTAADLKLGMTVEIDSGEVDRVAGTAVATTVRVHSELLGPVSASDLAAGTLTVLGETVQVTASTVFDSRLTGGQVAVAVGSLVEVYALYDPVANVYAARRIEPVSAATRYKVRGPVSALDTGAKTFRIGSASFLYGTAPAGLADGQQVSVQVQTSRDAQGRWVVGALGETERQLDDGTEVELEGVISSYVSISNFQVGGQAANASGASVSPAGATLAAGVRVEVHGRVSGGVLQVTEVEVKQAEDGGGSGDDGGGLSYKAEGKITALDTTAKTFVVTTSDGVHATAFSYANYAGSNVSQLALNKKVEVKGTLAADGITINVTEI